MIYFDPGICHFGTNQEVLKEDLLLDDITILNINYIGSGAQTAISATQ
jgi:hypothetical protein